MNPKDDLAHNVLVRTHVWKGYWLVHKGEWDGAIAEFREALRFNPKNELAHDGLGLAHEREGRWLVNKGELGWGDRRIPRGAALEPQE